MPTPEEKIREQRLLEATRKEYVGMNGKFGIILQNMGEPIMGHGSPLYDVSYLETPYPEYEEEEEMGYFDEDEAVAQVGWLFSGLSRGMHIEIKYEDTMLSIHYKGYLVYLERAGNLECFFPHNLWEQDVEQLYKVAIKLQRAKLKNNHAENNKQKEAKKEMWLQEMWRKWGFKL